MKETKTNAMRILDRAGISYRIHTYPHHGQQAVDGMTVALLTGQDPQRVYKTLVCESAGHRISVFVIPVAAELDMKKAARAAGEKALELVPLKNLLQVSGYIRGGCSPIGMKKDYPTWIDSSAQPLSSILFSGGRIGCQIEMNPNELAALIHARFEDVIRSS